MHSSNLQRGVLVIAAGVSIARALPSTPQAADRFGAGRIEAALQPLRYTADAALANHLRAAHPALSQLGPGGATGNNGARDLAAVRAEVAEAHAKRKEATDEEAALRAPLLADDGGRQGAGGASSSTTPLPSSCPPTAEARKPFFASVFGFILSKLGLAPPQPQQHEQQQAACPPGSAPLPDQSALNKAAERTRRAERDFLAAVSKLPLPPPLPALSKDLNRRPRLVECLIKTSFRGSNKAMVRRNFFLLLSSPSFHLHRHFLRIPRLHFVALHHLRSHTTRISFVVPSSVFTCLKAHLFVPILP
jgi:hypothetical protein